jgi:hypothetical protein
VAVEIDNSNQDVTIFKITDKSEFGKSDIDGFLFVKFAVTTGFQFDGYVTTKPGNIIHNHKIDLISSVVQMESVTLIALPKIKSLIKIYIPTSVYSYDEVKEIIQNKMLSNQSLKGSGQ